VKSTERLSSMHKGGTNLHLIPFTETQHFCYTTHPSELTFLRHYTHPKAVIVPKTIMLLLLCYKVKLSLCFN